MDNVKLTMTTLERSHWLVKYITYANCHNKSKSTQLYFFLILSLDYKLQAVGGFNYSYDCWIHRGQEYVLVQMTNVGREEEKEPGQEV